MSDADDPAVLIVHPGVRRTEIAVVEVSERRAFALDAWAIGTDGEGGITIGDQLADADAMRALWTRLGVVLGQVDRDMNAAAWERLRRQIDAEYAYALPVRAELRRGSEPGQKAAHRGIGALVYRADAKTALIRTGNFEMAILHPRTYKTTGTWWEGVVQSVYPGPLDESQTRPTRIRCRLGDEAARAAPLVDPDMGRVMPPRRLLVDLSAPVGRGSPALPPKPRG